MHSNDFSSSHVYPCKSFVERSAPVQKQMLALSESEPRGNLSMKIGFSLQQVQGELGKGNVCTVCSRGLYVILATYGRSAT